MGVDVGCVVAVDTTSVAVLCPVTGMEGDGGKVEILQAIIASIAKRGYVIQRG